jgi:hypothetical protein
MDGTNVRATANPEIYMGNILGFFSYFCMKYMEV